MLSSSNLNPRALGYLISLSAVRLARCFKLQSLQCTCECGTECKGQIIKVFVAFYIKMQKAKDMINANGPMCQITLLLIKC